MTHSTTKPSSTTFEALLVDIKKGSIKIPQFQRDFVWERARSAKLLDSILKGYPLGTFIFWKTKERLRAVKDIGGIILPVPPEGDYVLQVLDGQQRITSLFAALEGVTIQDREDFSTIVIDMDANPDSDDVLVFPISDIVPMGHKTIPFNFLRTKTSRQLGKDGFSEEQLDRMDHYKERLATYPFPTVEILDAPLPVATEIFTRLNVGGKSLSVFEIMVAKTWDETLSFDLNEKVEELNKELITNGFGEIDHTIIMQNVTALTIQSIRARDILSIDKIKFIDNWTEATNAFKQAIDFCKSDLGIPVKALLPYQRTLIPLSYYFYLAKSNPAGSTKQKLIDLFYRVGLSERYSSASETKIDQDLKYIKEIFDDKDPIYDYGIDISADYIARNGYFRTGKAYIKTLLCILAKNDPLCFETGGKVILDNALMKQKNSRNFHHFFPLARLSELKNNQYEPNHIANITLVGANLNKNKIRAKLPSVYIKEFEINNKIIEDCLSTHFIDHKTMGIMDNNYEIFFKTRCEKFSAALHEYLIPQKMDTIAPVQLESSDDNTEIED